MKLPERHDRQDRKPPSELKMGIMLVLAMVGACVGTVVGLIVLTIIVGLADGH